MTALSGLMQDLLQRGEGSAFEQLCTLLAAADPITAYDAMSLYPFCEELAADPAVAERIDLALKACSLEDSPRSDAVHELVQRLARQALPLMEVASEWTR